MNSGQLCNGSAVQRPRPTIEAGMTISKAETSADQLFFTTLRIEPDTGALGTGVIVSHTWAEGKTGSFLATNKHVVSGSKSGKLPFTLADSEGNIIPGITYDLTFGDSAWKWTGHPDDDVDVAVLPIQAAVNQIRTNGFEPYFFTIAEGAIPSDEKINKTDAIGDVLMVGYPSGMYDEVNHLPILRRGITATPPGVDYKAKPIFLIDASVFPGSSGSPVFLWNPLGIWRSDERAGALEYGKPGSYLLGILGSGYQRPTSNTAGPQQEMIDLGIVYKTRTIIETIQCLLNA